MRHRRSKKQTLNLLALLCMTSGAFTACNIGKNNQSSELPWHLFGEYGINIGPAWNISTGNKDVTIAIIDGQFLPNNPAFSQGQCLASTGYFNFIKDDKDTRYHGAAVASLINTCENNPLDLMGIIKKGRILWKGSR